MMMMTMIGDPPPRSSPTVQIPTYDYYPYLADDSSATHIIHSPISSYSPDMSHYDDKALAAALQRYLPSNNKDDVVQVTANHSDSDDFDIDFDFPMDAFSCDEFRMYEFKVKKCVRSRSHDWTECPFAHPGEKAHRRDPRKYHYSGTACPEFRKAGGCKKGDACEYSHGVFECWLHPARYRTQPCKDGTHCKRRVCFFAHTPDQLRTTQEASALLMFGSPPSSPTTAGPSPINLVESMRGLHINKKNGNQGLGMCLGGMNMSPPAWGLRYGGSPQSPSRRGFISLPSTPACNIRSNLFDVWEEEEPVMERVESGKLLRDKMYAKLEKENSLDRGSSSSDPDFGWVSELVM